MLLQVTKGNISCNKSCNIYTHKINTLFLYKVKSETLLIKWYLPTCIYFIYAIKIIFLSLPRIHIYLFGNIIDIATQYHFRKRNWIELKINVELFFFYFIYLFFYWKNLLWKLTTCILCFLISLCYFFMLSHILFIKANWP